MAIRRCVTWPGEVLPVTPLSAYTSPATVSLPPQVAIASRPSGNQSIALTCGWNPAGRRLVSV